MQNDYCNSGKCALFCVQCLSDQDCPSQQFCIAGACAPQVGIGTPCLGVSCRNLASKPYALTLSLNIAHVSTHRLPMLCGQPRLCLSTLPCHVLRQVETSPHYSQPVDQHHSAEMPIQDLNIPYMLLVD